MEQQQADALGLLAEAALTHGIDPGSPAERYQVVVHVDAAVLENADAPGQSVLDGGTRVSAETSQRLACDASRVLMRDDRRGRIVEVSSRARTIPAGIPLDAHTARPTWLGERLNVSYAIDVLHPRANKPGEPIKPIDIGGAGLIEL